jgi:hypothetical protein
MISAYEKYDLSFFLFYLKKYGSQFVIDTKVFGFFGNPVLHSQKKLKLKIASGMYDLVGESETEYDFDLIVCRSFIIFESNGKRIYILWVRDCEFRKNLLHLSNEETLNFVNENFEKKRRCKNA